MEAPSSQILKGSHAFSREQALATLPLTLDHTPPLRQRLESLYRQALIAVVCSIRDRTQEAPDQGG